MFGASGLENMLAAAREVERDCMSMHAECILMFMSAEFCFGSSEWIFFEVVEAFMFFY